MSRFWRHQRWWKVMKGSRGFGSLSFWLWKLKFRILGRNFFLCESWVLREWKTVRPMTMRVLKENGSLKICICKCQWFFFCKFGYKVYLFLVQVSWRTPKLLDGFNYESKDENCERTRSWGAFPGSQHFGGKGAWWSFGMGLERVTNEYIHMNLHKLNNKLASA
jgi:hypothetical protein